MFTTGLLICALLIINATIVRAILSSNLSNLDARINQASQFILPVLMIFVEFWLFDMATQRTHRQIDDEE